MPKDSIKVLIADDEPLARDYIRRLLEAYETLEIVAEAGNGREAAQLISDLKPELVFLDVQMPEMDGFSLLKTLNSSRLPAIIFTTAYEDYAIRAFEFHALDYLLKPFDQSRFQRAVEYAKERLESTEAVVEESATQITELLKAVNKKTRFLERLLIKQNGRIVFLKTIEIEWIKADDKYVHLCFGKSSYLVRQTLSALKAQLDSQIFVQISRSVIVNIEFIKEIHPLFSGEYELLMKNGAQINVSRNFKNHLFALLGKPL